VADDKFVSLHWHQAINESGILQLWSDSMSTENSGWLRIKDHPVVIVIGFCAATAAATATIYEKIVLPYHVKVQEVEITELKRQLASEPEKVDLLKRKDSQLAEKDSELSSLRAEMLQLRQRVVLLASENMFSKEDPYPKAFRLVRIGDLFSKLEDVYPGKVIKRDPDDTYASVKVDDKIFGEVTYYYEEQSKPQRVTSILFHLKYDSRGTGVKDTSGNEVVAVGPEQKVSMGALNAQLTERYGEGKRTKRETYWKINNVKLTLKDDGVFTLRME
jgi:hypothetical protein